jgi:F5/8 type C domain-containing protein
VAASASQNTVDAPLAVDHDAATRWEPLTAQPQGTWFQVDLGREQEVAEVDLWPRFAEATPPGLRVEASADGENWTTIAAAKDYWRFCSWAQNRPLPNLDGWIVVRFTAVRCRWIRLTDLGADNRLYYWVIDELRVRAPAGQPLRSWQPPPRVAGRLLADPVLAARWPAAVRHWQGKILPGFDLRDASLVGQADSIVVPNNDPLAVEDGDPRLGVSFARVTPLGDYASLSGLHLDTDDLERHAPARWQADPRSDTASVDLGGSVEISGVVVDHDGAASSFPRGLVARTSLDGMRWSDPEPLAPRPPEVLWSDEGLLGASLRRRIFLFPNPRRARFVTLSAFHRQPRFPWVVRSITALFPHRGPSA